MYNENIALGKQCTLRYMVLGRVHDIPSGLYSFFLKSTSDSRRPKTSDAAKTILKPISHCCARHFFGRNMAIVRFSLVQGPDMCWADWATVTVPVVFFEIRVVTEALTT